MSGKAGKHNINYLLHGSNVTLTGDEGTAVANRALIVDANKAVDVLNTATLSLGTSGSETAITATGAEINTTCDGNTATAAEITRVADTSARIVTTTATALSLTVTEHAERIVLINSNSTGASAFTLPTATGSGAKFTLVNNVAQTQGTIVVQVTSTDVMNGVAMNFSTTQAVAQSFPTTATSDTVTLNATTTGGEIAGDKIELWDSSANTWTVQASVHGSGSLATPFSAAVT